MIRNSTTDVQAIGRNMGYKPERIQKIKNYLFDNADNFDADPEIAMAWHRMRTGKGTPNDRLLLKHETAEMWLKEIGKYEKMPKEFRDRVSKHDWAHQLAQEKYDWAKTTGW